MNPTIKHLEGRYKTISFKLVQMCDDAELRLYLFLKFHAIEKHDCFPAVSTMENGLGWSKNKVLRTIKQMRKARRLRVEVGGGRVSNVYDITWYDYQNEAGFASARPLSTRSSPRYAQGFQNGTSRGSKMEPLGFQNGTRTTRNGTTRNITTRGGGVDKFLRSGPRTGKMESIATVIKRKS